MVSKIYKIIIIIAVFLYLIILGFGQYVAVKRHNSLIFRDALNTCVKDSFNSESRQNCVEAMTDFYVMGWLK